MKSKHAIIILISVFFFGCKTENKKAEVKISESKEVSLLDTLQLKMNHGEKWIANSETHEGIKIMDSMINSFYNQKTNNYKLLGQNLSNQTSYIIKNCNMVGESHDQLHVVLVPMLNEISNLKDADNNANAEPSLTNLKVLIKDYFKFFKL